MGTPATVGVDDDLAAGQASVTLRTANDEATGRLDLESLYEPMFARVEITILTW